MDVMTARVRRFFGAGLMLLVLQGLALASVALAAGFFHHRMHLLLEPIAVPVLMACGCGDAVARMQVAEDVLARANAFDGWQPLFWLVASALLLTLLGALAVCLQGLLRAERRHRRSACGLLGLHVLALPLAAAVLRLYEQVWAGIVTGLPVACMAEPLPMEDGAALPVQRSMAQVLAEAGTLPPQAPDALAIVLCGLLLAAMVVGVWLWRAGPVPR